jgi:DNA recombination protein RmuC
MLLLGVAIGAGLVWFLLGQRIELARQNERHAALADVRVAQELAGVKDKRIAELQNAVSTKEHDLEQRGEEITQLKEYNAKLLSNLRNEEGKTQEKLKLLGEVEDQFVARLSEPVKETLEKLNAEITLVKNNATTVGVAAANLAKALQRPDARGRWGEMSLERVFEICGLTEGRDYHKQRTIGDDDSQLRPDYVVCMPGGLHLAIDAKAPISAYLEAVETGDDRARDEHLKKFVTHVRERVKNLNSKRYHQYLENSPECVVLFLPAEAIVSAALRLDAGLIEFATAQNVILAGPTVVISIVQGIAHGWKQESLTKHAKDIAELGKELYKRLADFGGHVANIGYHLKNSTKAYNDAVGSLQSRVLPQARKLEELKVAPADKRIPELAEVETIPRDLRGADFALADVVTDGELFVEEAAVRPR